jgi:glutamate formiminotransferase
VIVGARKFLIAFNINLETTDLAVAKQIAKAIRESSGGFPAVKALGLALPTRGVVQVSINLTDFDRTSLFAVFEEVSRLAAEQGLAVLQSELIGLIPRRAMEDAAGRFLKPASG